MRSNKFKGCGFLSFHNAESVQRAAELNGTVVLGRPMRVDFAKDRKEGAYTGAPRTHATHAKEMRERSEPRGSGARPRDELHGAFGKRLDGCEYGVHAAITLSFCFVLYSVFVLYCVVVLFMFCSVLFCSGFLCFCFFVLCFFCVLSL
jgi:hypothetical protein